MDSSRRLDDVVDYFAVGESQTSLPGSTHAQSPPVSMPAPAVPRRAGPPRKRSAKSPISINEVAAPTAESVAETAGDANAASVSEDTRAEATSLDKGDVNEELVTGNDPPQQDDASIEDDNGVKGKGAVVRPSEEVYIEDGSTVDAPLTEGSDEEVSAPPESEEEGEEEQDDEEEEAARRHRIAERIAKAGGMNPLAGAMPLPPRRRSSELRSPDETKGTPISPPTERKFIEMMIGSFRH